MATPVTISCDQSKNLKLRFRKGEGRTITLQFFNDSLVYDISGYAFLFQVLEVDGSTAVFELSEGDGIINGGATGVLTITIPGADVDLDEKTYEWKLKVTAPSTKTWFNGQFQINDSPQEVLDSDSTTVTLDLGDIMVEVTISAVDVGVWIDYTPVWTGFSADPTGVIAKYHLVGKVCTVLLESTVNGTSNANTKTVTLPFPSGAGLGMAVHQFLNDSGLSASLGSGVLTAASNVLNLFTDFAAGVWPVTGDCRILRLILTYEVE